MTTKLFETSIADGVRKSVGIVGVDSGTMVIAERFLNEEDRMDLPFTPGIHDGCVFSSTGLGDGGYDVLEVLDSSGSVRGVEVMFLSRSIEAETEKKAEQATGDHLSEDEITSCVRGEADETLKERYNAYNQAWSESYNEVQEAMIPDLHPKSDAAAEELGEITVKAKVGIGDPCYGGPSETVVLPAGRYVAVAWKTDMGDWGVRVARLGIYKVSDAGDGS